MRYQLIEGSNAGVVLDPTPIIRDIKDTFEVSFLLPSKGAYIALFRGEDNVEYKSVIRNGTALIPKELLNKEQAVSLTVCQTDGESILHAWDCRGFRVGQFLNMRQSLRQIIAADDSFFARLAELECDNAALQNANRETAELVSRLREEIRGQTETLAGLKAENAKLATAYNKSIEVINDLSKRLAAVEKHYDPTLIK